MSSPPQISILFVCMGNICRSPTAEGIFRTIVEREFPELDLEIDSAGTHAYHVGDPPDHRAQAAASRRGYDLSRIRARRVSTDDFLRFDYVLAMDDDNMSLLRRQCPVNESHRIRLFLEFAQDATRLDVPDPYYGGGNGFEQVLDLVESASHGLAKTLAQISR